MPLFQAPLDTCLDSPFFVGLSVHGLHFTVYAPSICFVAGEFFGFCGSGGPVGVFEKMIAFVPGKSLLGMFCFPVSGICL